jgi:hypothetical protein
MRVGFFIRRKREMDTRIALLMVRLKDDIPLLRPLWLYIWRHELNRQYRNNNAA